MYIALTGGRSFKKFMTRRYWRKRSKISQRVGGGERDGERKREGVVAGGFLDI